MTEDQFQPSRPRYEARQKQSLWPFIVGGILVVGVGAYILTGQAYRPPYGEVTIAQALGASATGIALRVVPLIVIAWAALYFGVLRRTAPGQAIPQAVVLVAAGLIGAGAVVGLAAREEAEYEASGRPEAQRYAARAIARYDTAVSNAFNAVGGRMSGLFGYDLFVRHMRTPEGIPEGRRRVETARESFTNYRTAITEAETAAITEIQRAPISRFARAEAIATVRARVAERRPLFERSYALNDEILGEISGAIDALEASQGRWRMMVTGPLFNDRADFNAFNAHFERVQELAREADQLSGEIRRGGAPREEIEGTSDATVETTIS